MRSRLTLNQAGIYLLLILGAVVSIYPFVWMTLSSFKSYGETASNKEWPFSFSLAYFLQPKSPTTLADFKVDDFVYIEGRPGPDGIQIVTQMAYVPSDNPHPKGREFRITEIRGDELDVESEVGYATVRVDTNTFYRGRQTIPTLLYNFQVVLDDVPFLPQFNEREQRWWPGYFANSLFTSFITVAGVLCTSTLAAYAFARLRFPGRDTFFLLFQATMMIPGQVTMIPNFLMVNDLGWRDTYLALTLPFFASAFDTFLLRQFFAQIPNELHDAALIDGCGHFRFLWQIAIPLSRAALVTTALLTFLGSWNALLWPMIVINKTRLMPVQVGLKSFVVDEGVQTQQMMAASLLAVLPTLILYFFTQKTFTEGISTTGLKG
ncbi:MAG: carbohydrate ABC transporter permease [Chloroflexota bacterium]